MLDSTKEETEAKLRILHSVLSGKPITERTMDPELVENEVERLCMKGDMLFYGSTETNFQPDYKGAMHFYYDAAQCKSGRACSCLGRMYEKGLGVDISLDLAAEYYKMGADMNDGFCLFALGKYYEKGIIGKSMEENERIQKAVDFYEKAVRYHNTDAMTKLGYMYNEGIFLKKNHEKAIQLFETAASNDNALAMNFLGADYFKAEDYKKASQYFIKGALLGCYRAANNLGICYENGLGISKDEREALYWYRKAAINGHPEAAANTGLLSFKFGAATGNIKYYVESLKWLFQAYQSNQASKETNYILGVLFQKGLGTDRDLCTAIDYFEEADKLGSLYAPRKWADSLLELSKTKENPKKYPKKIEELYKKGYNNGDLAAGYNLAMGYIKGSWIERNENRGIELMEELKSRKFIDAERYLGAFPQ